jgi:hypothetical protein
MAFIVGFMWFRDEGEKERDDITTDLKEEERTEEEVLLEVRTLCLLPHKTRTGVQMADYDVTPTNRRN